MPSHKIHIKVAQDINKILKLDNDSIMLGSVLPDLTIEKKHGVSHFQYSNKYPDNLANANEFVKIYPDINDDISIGYIIHLLTDRFYNNWYYKKYRLKGIEPNREFKHRLFDSYDKYILKHFKLNKFNNTNVIKKIPKYKDFSFDESYLKEYITNYNKEIDKSNIDLEFVIEKQKELDQVYDECIKYIMGELIRLKKIK